jgi:hypothetical protein
MRGRDPERRSGPGPRDSNVPRRGATSGDRGSRRVRHPSEARRPPARGGAGAESWGARIAGTRAALVAGLALIVAAPLAIHLPAISAPFFADDYLFVDQVRGRSMIEVLAAPDPIGNFFRPVGRQLWFWTLTHAFGESPAAFHALGLVALVAILVLFFLLARGLAGARAALLGTGFLAAHYASDVPVRWAAGSQDLLAVLGAMAALLLHARGRSLLAAVALLVGLLSKETVLFTPLIAVVVGRRAEESWAVATRRAWPLFAAAAAWAALWIVRSPQALAPSAGVSIDPTGALAALAHLVQVIAGWEARPGQPLRVSFAPMALVTPLLVIVGAALALPGLRKQSRARGARGASAIPMGIAWALLATAPVAAVASIWSAYYYLFAMCGVALVLGAWMARWPAPAALAALALLGAGSAMGRSLDDFALARGPWTGQSHLNRFYIDRAVRESSRYLTQMVRRRTEFPRGSMVFFAGIKGSVAFQTADGPVLRWAYRDPTLRSFYINQFSRERVGQAPVFLYYAIGDTLREAEPGVDTFGRLAFGLMLSDRFDRARVALEMLRERVGAVPGVGIFEAWIDWSLGDTTQARSLLLQEHLHLDPGPTPEREAALASLAAGDTASAIERIRNGVLRHALDPNAHALLADILLMIDADGLEPAIETIAVRALTPRDPFAWRRFAMLQMYRNRHPEALASLDRYFALAGAAGREDVEAQRWVQQLRRRVPGSALAHESLRR